jgi:tetratricopeptide (TPR) repeat protein
VPEHTRIEELRRRVEADPASIAFAQLAEEYRRLGEFEDAVRVCRAGLEQHPAYLSARVTLGRALMELGRYDEARATFEHVLGAAPDNLIALRSMADIHQRREEHADAAASRPAAVDPALPELEAWLTVILEDRAARAAS